MNKRIIFLTVLLVILPFVVAACGGDVSEDDAEKTVKAAFEGDVDEANKNLCDDDKLEGGDVESVEGLTIGDIECKKDGDKMNCDYTMSMEVEGTEQSFDGTISFDIEDGKLCGGDIAAQ
ncbi:MAG: hypothetical protein K8I82_07515 [Anaerolineae bacterium]|jgi:hypothetical protein|nr:hypothetical protein [Anaerolineae bacterium]